MVKKRVNKLKIDFQNCIIEDKLLQVKNHGFYNELSLVPAWSIIISTQASKQVVNLVRELSLKDPFPLTHIKRIQKINNNQLNVVICSVKFLNLDQVTEELQKNEIHYQDLKIQQVPEHCPATKDLAIKWSSLHWPLLWKGNPNDQVLNDVIIDLETVKYHLQQITEKACCSNPNLPIVTAIVDPSTNKVISLSIDERHLHPLDHSIMKCIQNVALFEQTRRKTCTKEEHHYLCENFHVYTTHEPCTMCSMALIHSRVSRLVYINQMPNTGALNPKSGEGYMIQNHKLLNSSFEVWEWLGDEYHINDIDNNLNA